MRSFVNLVLIVFCIFSSQFIFAGENSSLHEISSLSAGEKLTFDIDVLFLNRVAVGSAELELIDEENLIFKARVEAEIVRFFLKRRNVYESLMRYSHDEKKFKPLSFKEIKYKKEKSYMKHTFYDEDKGLLIEEKWRDGKLDKRKEKQLPQSEFYEDVVTAFYNVRVEAYGKVEEGKKFVVKSMHKDGKFYFTITILEGKVRNKIASKEEDCKYKGIYYAEVMTPKEVFNAQGGRLFIGFTRDLVPNFVLVKKVLGIGTIKGRLVEIKEGFSESSPQVKDSTISKKPGKE